MNEHWTFTAYISVHCISMDDVTNSKLIEIWVHRWMMLVEWGAFNKP